MKGLWQKIKTPVIAVVIIVLVFFAYSHFFQGSSQSTSLTSDSSASSTNPDAAAEQQFLTLLLKIQNITINQSIFSDPVFLSLQDDSLPVVDQPQGRTNPFAPIGNDAVSPGTTSTSTFSFQASTSSVSTSNQKTSK
jgi:hypothetical protein